MSSKSKISRRDFLKFSAIGAAGALLAPSGLTAATTQSSKSKSSANDTINIGFIGLGQQAMHLLNGFITIDGVRVVAGCDVYDIKRARFEKRVKDYYTNKGEKKCTVDLYEDYQDVLARPDIDAVVIATPDHQHALIAIAACKAGKDVYLEKPLTLTIYEGQQLRKAVRKYNRILQVGSQQRSDAEFIHAANLCREGELGKINLIKVHVGGSPTPYTLPKQEVPAGLNWDKWLGPLSEEFYYNSDLNPIITLEPEQNEQLWGAWRWYKGMGGGLMTDWGAHMFDIAQWAMGKDGNGGPVEIIPAGYSYYDHLTYKYDNGTTVTEQEFDGAKQGVKIYGDNGWIQVCRGEFIASDPKFMPEAQKEASDMPYETKVGHYQTFINSIRSRIDPNVPVETGHTSCTVCNLGNIANELKRPVVWNPIVEKFMNDPEATALLHYEYRPGYSLDV
ncbi:MAG TPA: Gfo/Idh/MocA family oxidoreductase [Candidatus Alistipes merdigallinarum]|nr:Gfo/Idh/MocA family oxidoreductase [Candidatus Alistipes merdigallinarum]